MACQLPHHMFRFLSEDILVSCPYGARCLPSRRHLLFQRYSDHSGGRASGSIMSPIFLDIRKLILQTWRRSAIDPRLCNKNKQQLYISFTSGATQQSCDGESSLGPKALRDIYIINAILKLLYPAGCRCTPTCNDFGNNAGPQNNHSG